MIQEICIFGMGFVAASAIRVLKIASIIREKHADLSIAIKEGEKMQEKIKEGGPNENLAAEQIESIKQLEKHIAYEEMLKRFNYLIW